MNKAVEWRDIPGCEGAFQASRCGKVRSLDRYVDQMGRWGPISRFQRGRILAENTDRDGYKRVCAKGAPSVFVHRLVGMAWLPNPHDLPQINHKDGCESNNKVDNLEWVTNSENHLHACRVLGRKPTRSGMKITQLSHPENGVRVFPSAVEAACALGVVKTAVMNAARTGGKCKGYEVKYV